MTPSQPSRRRYQRIPAESAVLVILLGDAPAEQLTVTSNVGIGGCAYVSTEPCGVGAHVKLLITVDGRVITARARVAYENPLSDGRYEIGAEFLEIDDVGRDRIGRLFPSD